MSNEFFQLFSEPKLKNLIDLFVSGLIFDSINPYSFSKFCIYLNEVVLITLLNFFLSILNLVLFRLYINSKILLKTNSGSLVKSSYLIKRYLFTVSGLNAATQSDHQDLTDNKIKELKNSGVTLVVFKKVKDDKFSNEQSVISYENFFSNVYPIASKNWKKKII